MGRCNLHTQRSVPPAFHLEQKRSVRCVEPVSGPPWRYLLMPFSDRRNAQDMSWRLRAGGPSMPDLMCRQKRMAVQSVAAPEREAPTEGELSTTMKSIFMRLHYMHECSLDSLQHGDCLTLGCNVKLLYSPCKAHSKLYCLQHAQASSEISILTSFRLDICFLR